MKFHRSKKFARLVEAENRWCREASEAYEDFGRPAPLITEEEWCARIWPSVCDESQDRRDWPVPGRSSMKISRDALLFYVFLLLYCDPDGICVRISHAGICAGIMLAEQPKLLDELLGEKLLAIALRHDSGEIAAVHVRDYRAPLLQKRMSPTLWSSLKQTVFQRDNYTCRYCHRGKESVDLECDHVVPLHQGGTNEPGNLVTACADCNRSKRNTLIEKWRGRTA